MLEQEALEKKSIIDKLKLSSENIRESSASKSQSYTDYVNIFLLIIILFIFLYYILNHAY